MSRRFSLFGSGGIGHEYVRMLCRRLPCASFLFFAAFSVWLTGCHHDSGTAPDAQVEALQTSSELDRTKRKLAATEKESAAKDATIVAAKDEVEKSKKELADRNAAIAETDKRIATLLRELADIKKRDAIVYAEISKLHQQGLNTSALDRYKQFVVSYPTSSLVADANRAISELSVTAPKEARARASAIDPFSAEREILKKFNDGFATPEDLAPLLRRKSMADVVKLLGQPNTTYREGKELGYVDKVVDAASGARGTLVVGFEDDRVVTLRVGYLGRPIRP
jgi:hypothetical protein